MSNEQKRLFEKPQKKLPPPAGREVRFIIDYGIVRTMTGKILWTSNLGRERNYPKWLTWLTMKPIKEEKKEGLPELPYQLRIHFRGPITLTDSSTIMLTEGETLDVDLYSHGSERQDFQKLAGELKILTPRLWSVSGRGRTREKVDTGRRRRSR